MKTLTRLLHGRDVLVALAALAMVSCASEEREAIDRAAEPLATCASTPVIYTHTALCDASNERASWAPGTGDKAFDHVLGLNASWFFARPNATATDTGGQGPLSVKPWIATSYLCSGGTGTYACSPKGSAAGWPQNNAGLNRMMMESGLELYAYKGDATLLGYATAFLDHRLAYGLTASTDSWASVPSTDGTSGCTASTATQTPRPASGMATGTSSPRRSPRWATRSREASSPPAAPSFATTRFTLPISSMPTSGSPG